MIGEIASRMFNGFGGAITSAGSWLADLSADLFWGTVTSYPAIALYGAAASAAFVVAHVPALVQRFFPQLLIYVQAAGKVCLVASAALMFAFGYRVADGRDEIEKLKNDLAWAEYQDSVRSGMIETAEKLRQEADQRASDAEGQLGEYKKRFGNNPLDPPPGVLEWMRSLQQHPQRRADAGADKPQGGVVARVRALGAKRR